MFFFVIRFSWLPVTEDVDEAPFVYGFLADLIESNNQHILGSNNSNLPRVIAIIAEALAVEVLPPDNSAKLRMINLVNQVKVPSPQFFLFHNKYFIFAGQCGRVRGLCGGADGATEESNTGDPHQLAGIHLDNPRALSPNLKSDWIVWS